MPIKPENRARYPENWPEIRHEAGERAQWRCQHPGCNARQYAFGVWEGGDFFFEISRGTSYSEARQLAAEESFARHGDGPAPSDEKIIVIVLTCAHLDHQPENCDPENLRMLCQRHHLAHDHLHHLANAQATRRAACGPMARLVRSHTRNTSG